MPEAETAVHTRILHLPAVGTEGAVSLPEAAQGIVLFAHGSGSSRFSRRNTYVATALQHAGLPVGYFGASTGAAAAVQATFPIGTVVSRGGGRILPAAPCRTFERRRCSSLVALITRSSRSTGAR